MTKAQFIAAQITGWGLVLFPEPATTATGLGILALSFGLGRKGK